MRVLYIFVRVARFWPPTITDPGIDHGQEENEDETMMMRFLMAVCMMLTVCMMMTTNLKVDVT